MEGEPFTYDALRDLERRENTSPRLMKLEPRFWERLGEHLSSLRQAFQDQQEEDPTARRTVVLADELRNTQRLAESIWALREKKVVHAALAAARRREGTKAVPEQAMREERDLFVATLAVLVSARDEASITDPFSRRRRAREAAAAEQAANARPRSEESGGPDGDEAQQQQEREGAVVVAPVDGPGAAAERAVDVPHPEPAGAPQEGEEALVEGRGGVGEAGEQEVELRVVEALKEVPRFAGPDMVTYTLEEGEVGSLPRKAAEILAGRGFVRILLQA